MYGMRNCDTVKRARAWLEEKGIDYRFHDYKAAGIDDARLDRWCEELGWEALLNRAGTTFRKLPEGERQGLNRSKALALMRAHPSVIKRPIVETDDRLIVGFKPELYSNVQW